MDLNEASNPNHGRKTAKSKGVEAVEASRLLRADKAIQLRKDKRIDRANVERRKFKVENDGSFDNNKSDNINGAAAGNAPHFYNYTILPQKAAELSSSDPTEQLNSAIFFRRILAADKFPPLDLVINTGTVVPVLVSFLNRTESPSLQIEAAWSLTNIACGESKHINYLLEIGAMNVLLNTVATSNSASLRDQCLWAICNMTVAMEACQFLLQLPNALVLILLQVGIQCEILPTITTADSSSSSSGSNGKQPGTDTGTTHKNQAAYIKTKTHMTSGGAVTCDSEQQQVLVITQCSGNGYPSLSTMRHVSFTCGNVARLKATLALPFYRILLFAMSELSYSPDEEIVLDICSCLVTLVAEQPQVSDTVLELGLATRMKDLVDASSTSVKLYEMALLVLCTLLRNNQSLICRAVVLSLGAQSSSHVQTPHNSTNNSRAATAVHAAIAALVVNSADAVNTSSIGISDSILDSKKSSNPDSLVRSMDISSAEKYASLAGLPERQTLVEDTGEIMRPSSSVNSMSILTTNSYSSGDSGAFSSEMGGSSAVAAADVMTAAGGIVGSSIDEDGRQIEYDQHSRQLKGVVRHHHHNDRIIIKSHHSENIHHQHMRSNSYPVSNANSSNANSSSNSSRSNNNSNNENMAASYSSRCDSNNSNSQVMGPARAVITHIVSFMCRSDNNLTRVDLCRALVGAFDSRLSQSLFIATNCIYSLGLLENLHHLIALDTNDVNEEVGLVLVALLSIQKLELNTDYVLNKIASLLTQLLITPNIELLVHLLYASQVVFRQAGAHSVWLQCCEEFKTQLDLLVIHPFSPVSSAAVLLEQLMAMYCRAVGAVSVTGGAVDVA